MTEEAIKQKALPAKDALQGLRLGISVSESSDLARLGLTESHFRLAIGEIARSVLVCGGKLAYGGHLDPNGYTAFLIQELYRYGRRDKPLCVYLAWQEHQKISLGTLKRQSNKLGMYGDIICLDVNGERMNLPHERSEEPIDELDESIIKQSLTAMRHHMAENIHGRVLIGGKREGFQGNCPGIVEEAIISLEKNQPIYIAGGFGGITLDIIKAMRLDDCSWFPEKLDSSASDKRLAGCLQKITNTQKTSSWTELQNGLNDAENKMLAATCRPSEIAALINMGLYRLACLSKAKPSQ